MPTALSPDGVVIHYRVDGHKFPTLLLVHGWSGDQSYWEAQVKYFSNHHQVVRLDLAGHGRSGLNRLEWTIPAFAQDVVSVVDALALNQVVLVGHSMGGPVVLEAALLRPEPVLAVVGVDTFFDRWALCTQEHYQQHMAAFRTAFGEGTRNWVRQRLFLPSSDPALVERIALDMSQAPPPVGVPAMEAVYKWGRKHLKSTLQRLNKPLYIIQAEVNKDSLEIVRRCTNAFPLLEVMLMEGVGHFAMLEDASTFNRLLAAAIRRIQATRP